MKRDASIVAGLAAVLMLFGLTGRQPQGPVSPPAGSALAGSASKRNADGATANESQDLAYLPCSEILQRLQRLVTDDKGNDFERLDKLPALPRTCYGSHTPPKGSITLKARSGVNFAIATAPDPVSTHLPLLFDRIVESIQQAAQDDGYSYDGSWFPWEAENKDYTHLRDQLAAEDLQEIQQAQPGVMVFRQEPSERGGDAKDDNRDAAYRSSEAKQGPIGKDRTPDDPNPYEGSLVVFVVGEQPTGGLRDQQFDNAVAWLHLLSAGRATSTSPEPLRILGPTFSGSLPSLQYALQRNLGKRCDSPPGPDAPLCAYVKQNQIKVSSGYVTSGYLYKAFGKWMSGQSAGSFITAEEDDSLLTGRFCQYLRAQGYDLSRVAALSEDETAFGASLQYDSQAQPDSHKQSDPQNRPGVSLYYPRDIAAMRSAYEQQSIFAPSKDGSGSEAPATRLRGDLSEPPGHDNDTVRHYGGPLTPLQQESILTDIAHRLDDKRVEFIILRSTNSLDEIFLAEFLRRAYPEGRVVMDGADLLFTAGSWGGLLRGTMVLSTYPLLTIEPDWTSSLLGPRSGAYRTFGADASEGVYIAARELFHNPRGGDQVPIHDYSPPAWFRGQQPYSDQDEVPATWLTVIAHRRFWPVAALNRDKNSSILQSSSQRGDGPPIKHDYGDPRLPEIPVTMWAFLLFCWICVCIHFLLCVFPSVVRSPRIRTYFMPLPRWEHPALIALSGFLLASLAVMVAAASGWFASRGGTDLYRWPQTSNLLGCWLLFVLMASILSTVLNYRLTHLVPGGRAGSNTLAARSLSFTAAVVFGLLVLGVYLHMNGSLTAANAVPVYWRCLDLLSGVSGMLPQVILVAAMYAWCWCRLRGLAHLGEDRPLLPSENDFSIRMPIFTREQGMVPVEEAVRPLGWGYLLMLVAAFLLTVAGSSLALQGCTIHVLAERLFGTFTFWWFCLCVAAVLANAAQLLYVWTRLRRLLVHLDRLPLRRTLRALKGLEWGSIWKVSGNVLEERYRVISLQIESLRHLKNTLALRKPANQIERERIRDVQKQIESCLYALPGLVDWYQKLQAKGKVECVNPVTCFQERLAATAGLIMTNLLVPGWQAERESLIFDHSTPADKSQEDKSKEAEPAAPSVPAHVQTAEEFFILPYLAFIQNTLGQMRSIILGTLWLFVGTTVAFSSYPFEPVNVLGALFLVVFVLVGVPTIVMYAQMCRDATLSHITHTNPGELGWEFWTRLAGFGIGPLVGLLATLFPSISDFVFSWFQPGMEALR